MGPLAFAIGLILFCGIGLAILDGSFDRIKKRILSFFTRLK